MEVTVDIDPEDVLNTMRNDEIVDYIKQNWGLEQFLCYYFNKKKWTLDTQQLIQLVEDNLNG